MKTFVLTLAFFISAALSLQAAVLTVSNHANGGAQYGSLASAYAAASNGDTLMLEPTNIAYTMASNTYFEKELVLIGVGWNPNTASKKRALIFGQSNWNQLRLLVGAAGSKFYGIEFTRSVAYNNNGINNLLFENCMFHNHFYYNNYNCTNTAFRNCIFTFNNTHNIDFPSTIGITCIIENCVFDGYLEGHNNSTLDITVNHCVFLKPTDNVFNDFNSSLTVNNSIFYNVMTFWGSTFTGNSLNNNIFRLSTALPAGNSGSGNLFTTDPLFVNVPFSEYSTSAHDYDLQGGSPGIGAGNDGTDIGIHGGTSNFNETGEPLNVPIMTNMVINNTSVEPGGTLNVQVKARKPSSD